MGRSRNEEVFRLRATADTSGFDDTVESIGDLEGGLSDVGRAARGVSESSTRAENSLGKLRDITIIGAGALGVASAAASGLSNAFNATVGTLLEFNDIERMLAVQTGATGEELDSLSESARNLFSANYGENIEDVAQALAQVANVSDLTGEALEAATADAILMRDAFGQDIVESIRTADTIVEQFGGTTDEAFDLLIHGIQETGDPAQDLLDTFNEYGGNLAQMGFTAEKSLNLLAQGLDGGARNTDDLADALREFQILLLDGSSEEAIRSLGGATEDMLEQFQRGDATAADVFETLQYNLSRVEDDIERNRLGVEIYGTKWEDVGEQALLAMDSTSSAIGTFDEIAGAGDRAAEALQGGIVNALQAAGRELQVSVVEGLDPYASIIENSLIPAIDSLGTWLAEDGIPGMIAFSESMGPVISDIMQIGENIVNYLGGADTIINAMATAGRGLADALSWLADGNLEEGLAAWGTFTTDFGPAVFQGLADSLPDPMEWTRTQIIDPILLGLQLLPAMVVQMLNNAIPNDVGFDVPGVGNPGYGIIPGASQYLLPPTRVAFDLPDDPIPMPSFAGGGSFTVGGGTGDPIPGSRDRLYALGLGDGEQVDIRPANAGASSDMTVRVPVMIDGRQIAEAVASVNNRQLQNRVYT